MLRRARGLKWQPAEDVQVLPGRGLTARVEGHDCLLGNEALFSESGIALPGDVAAPEPGVTRLWMALDGAVAGYFDARDALRPDAADAIAELRSEGLRVLMLTGDSAAAAAPIARAGGDYGSGSGARSGGEAESGFASCKSRGCALRWWATASTTLRRWRRLMRASRWERARIWRRRRAMCCCCARSRAAIPAALELARETLRIMRQNLGWAVGYNVIGIPLAAGLLYPAFHILLTPWLAAAAMALSSVCVLGNSLRLRGWQPAAQCRAGTLN